MVLNQYILPNRVSSPLLSLFYNSRANSHNAAIVTTRSIPYSEFGAEEVRVTAPMMCPKEDGEGSILLGIWQTTEKHLLDIHQTLEHIVASSIVKHFDQQHIFFELQHGFREKRSVYLLVQSRSILIIISGGWVGG